MKIIRIISMSLILVLVACHHPKISTEPQDVLGKLKVGFDIDDTIVLSRDNFLKAPKSIENPGHVDYGWVNTHDSLHSGIIKPIADVIWFLRSQGHEVYFITARPGTNGDAVGRYLERELGFPIVNGENLFFSTKKTDPETGNKYTTKHNVISQLGLHIFFGDSDSDMVAASIAGIRGVRVVRHQSSVIEYSRNYFGDTMSPGSKGAPHSEKEYMQFLSKSIGPYGETIYPIQLELDLVNQTQE